MRWGLVLLALGALLASCAGDAAVAARAAAAGVAARLRAAAAAGAANPPPPPPPPALDDDALLAAAARLSDRLTQAAAIMRAARLRALADPAPASYVLPCPLNSVKKAAYSKDDPESPSINKHQNVKQHILTAKSADDSNDLKIKRQHFLAASDSATDKNCRLLSDDSRLRRLFHDYFQPSPKQIIFIIDNGRSSNANELRIALSVALEMINALRKNDIMGIVTNDNELRLMRNCTISSYSSIGNASDENKEIVSNFINNLNISEDVLNFTSSIYKAIEMLDPKILNAMIVYVGTDSLAVDDIYDLAKIEDLIADKLNYTVVLSACSVELNYERYDGKSDVPNCLDETTGTNYLCKGAHVFFNSSFTIGEASSYLLLSLPRGAEHDNISVAAPVWDPVQRDLLVPLLLPCSKSGLIVLDLYLADLAQDITYFNPSTLRHRAFMIDLRGKVVMHSSYSRPEVVVAKPRSVDISLIETYAEFHIVKSLMLKSSNGNKTVRADRPEIAVTYTWKWVKKLFIICIVSETDNYFGNSTYYGRKVVSRRPQELQYHRIDLLPLSSGTTCRHFKQVSTIDRGTLYLSPSSFQTPFRYLHNMRNGNDISVKMLQSCMAYLKDTTRLLSNPGLKPEIRNDVGTLYPMLNYYKRQHIHGSYNKYIVRRYAATDRGVLVMFPGSILESDYEPNRKAWFTKAIQNPRRIILTPPYLDVGGAGYIVTVSYAPQDTPSNIKPNIVVSMDITMGFLYKILADSLQLCTIPDIKCFIMDDQGYLLSHPSLFDRRVSGPIEQKHITHKESLIANDMLHHKGFVQKELCKNFVDGTLQRYYRFNISINEVLTNYVNGEHCARYYITAIEGTNTFLGMVNSSCDMGAFCPCSIADRLCLNCYRMEQNECECPCECVLPKKSTCSASDLAAPICELQPEKNSHKNHYFYNIATHLKSCFDFQCDSYRSESSCLGVLGCEWCHVDIDGDSPLSTPFCSAQSACFGGVLGAVTPYGEGSLGHIMQDDLLASYSAVGPIAGCIVAVCLILAIAVYCYKQNSAVSSITDAYLGTTPDTWPENGVQMSHLASEDDIHDERSGHQDKLLLANDLAVPISPYRVLTGIRRPNTTGESDHGYSTMTPHDDSEHLAFALVEPFMSADGNAADNVSNSPALSSRTNITDPITILPCGKNNVIAPVTVHRHMEAT